MKFLAYLSASMFALALGFVYQNYALIATVTPTATQFAALYIGPDAYSCHVSGPTSYLCIRQDLSLTPSPTRLPTVTPLLERTATPVFGCKDYTVLATVLNVRAAPSLTGAILKTFKKGETISLSTKPSDTVLAENITWRLACGSGDPAAYVSQNWVEAKK